MDSEFSYCLFPRLHEWFWDEGIDMLPVPKDRFLPTWNVPMVPALNQSRPHAVNYFFSNHWDFARTARYARVVGMAEEEMLDGYRNASTNSRFRDLKVMRNRTDPIPFRKRFLLKDEYHWFILADPADFAKQNGGDGMYEGPNFTGIVDGHGMAILDLDGDGFLDMYANHAANSGVATGIRFGCHLYWGQPTPDPSFAWSLKGGVLTAKAAGLEHEGGNGRGRGLRVADFNNDGLLDLLVLTESRRDSRHSPSRIYYNNGNRTFRMDPSFELYGFSSLWTGCDLLVQRFHECPERIQYCRTVRGQYLSPNLWSKFRYDTRLGSMKQQQVSSPLFQRAKFGGPVWNTEIMDFDGDGELDFMLTGERSEEWYVYFEYSRNNETEIIPFRKREGNDWGRSKISMWAAVQDFNLDGELDLLIFTRSFVSQEERWHYRTDMYTKMASDSPPYWILVRSENDFPKAFTNKDGVVISNRPNIWDLATVDYNNDGFMDVVLTSESLLHLTNMFGASTKKEKENFGTSNCNYDPSFVSVVLRGNPVRRGNLYGIGSRVSLLVSGSGMDNNGPKKWFHRFVMAYSHGNSHIGGATDHRVVFGLGMEWKPILLQVRWQDGTTSAVSRFVIDKHMNQMTNPVVMDQRNQFQNDLVPIPFETGDENRMLTFETRMFWIRINIFLVLLVALFTKRRRMVFKYNLQ